MARRHAVRPDAGANIGKARPGSPSLWWWQAGLAATVAVLLYVQSAGYKFVYDDNVQIVLNPRIRSFSNLGQAFLENFWAFNSPGFFSNYYRPFLTVVYMIGHALGGLSPIPYHWISILLHAASALGVLWIGRCLFPHTSIGFWGALLFAAHPMHTESVTWIAGVTDVGCGAFYFAAIGSYLHFRDRAGRGLWLGISAVLFAMALFFKEMAFTLPVVIALLEWTRSEKEFASGLRRLAIRLVPFAAAFLAYLALRLNALKAFSHPTVPLQISPLDRALTMAYFVGRYFQDLLLPLRQNAFHVFRPFSQLSPAQWGLPLLLLAIYSGLVVWLLLQKEKILAFLALFAGVTLVPVLYLGGTGQNMYAERYLYMPSLGYCLLIAGAAHRWIARKTLQYALLGALTACLGLLTVLRNPVWRDNRTLYQTTLAVSPDAALLHNNLGTEYFEERDLGAARREFEKALESEAKMFARFPRDRATSLLGLSAIASTEGRLQDAWRLAREACEIQPDLADCYQAQGLLLGKQGKLKEAEQLLRYALKLQPNNVAARVNLGSALMLQGRMSEAEKEILAGQDIEPDNPGPALALASLYAQTGRPATAVRILQELLARYPRNTQARQLLSQLTATPQR